ncbi:MAG: hypothetical protein HFF50_06875 [Lawsonibacter sp.]|nr:hypothetical protein [Lawsonibacter sp.]
MGIQLLLWSPFYAILGVVTFAFVRWCMKWKAGRIFCGIVLLGLSAGLIYGLLRATGVILYPDDKSRSYYFFDSSFRTEGVQLAVPCALEMAVMLVAGRSGIQKKETQ